MPFTQRRAKPARKYLKTARTRISIRRPGISRSLTYSNPNVPMRVKRTAVIDNFVSAAGEVNKAYTFNLAQLPGVSDFTSMFDAYKIDKVNVTFWPFKATNQDPSTVSTYDIPRTYLLVDYDDDNPQTSTNLREYANCRISTMTRKLKISLVPKVAQAVYRTALTSAYAQPNKSIKLDMSYTDVPHYGIKYANTTSGTAGGFGYEVQVQFYVSLYGVR